MVIMAHPNERAEGCRNDRMSKQNGVIKLSN